MPNLKSIDEAAKIAKVSRRLLQQWMTETKLKRWKVPGDRRRFVDMDEIRRLKEPRQVP